jgi:hypothetical protein
MTASERFRIASMRYGDVLVAKQNYCEAYKQYDNAQKIGQLDEEAAGGFHEASLQCYPPTATPSPTLEVTATVAVDTVVPSDTPITPGP